MASKRKLKPAKSTFEHIIKQKRIDDRVKQLEKAIQYCKETNCKGQAAISAGICPDIKDPRTITRHLEGKIKVGQEKEYCQILTCDEEEILVQYIKNKNEALQSVRRNELNEVIMKMLKLRAITYRSVRNSIYLLPSRNNCYL